MANSLRANLTSDYLKAANYLKSKKARKRIVAYVESYDDIAFWRSILQDFEDDTLFFQVMLPSSTTLTKGKKMVLTNVLNAENLGDNLIACVDADYDFLLQDATRLSTSLNVNKYIFHTYVYAIENFFCFSETLHDVVVQATLNDKDVFDYKRYLREFSEIIYNLFLWNIWFTRARDTNAFPMFQFNNLIRIYGFQPNRPQGSLNRIRDKVERKREELHRNYPDLIEEVEVKMAKELEQLGLVPETSYLFIQGHHLIDQVVLRILRPICANLRQLREQYIKRLAQHKEQEQNELTAYQNSVADVEVVLKSNYRFKNLFAYQWLYNDVADYIKSFRSRL